MFLMSFNHTSFKKLFKTLNRFFEYVIAILQKKNIRFCYIGTAAKDRLIDRLFFSGFMKSKFGKAIQISQLLLTAQITAKQIEACLLMQDIVFVGGGNTEQMLKIWENKGFTAILNKLKKEDRLPILAGVSAGGMYPFHSGLTDATAGQYRALKCLDWLKHSFCPHSNSKIKSLCIYDDNHYLERMSAYKAAIKSKQLPPGYAVPDNCMLHFYDFILIKALSTNKNDNCFYVTADTAEPLDTFCLTKINMHDTVQAVLASLGFRGQLAIVA